MAPWKPNPAQSKNPRLAKIREMRSEISKLDAALAPLEAHFASGRSVGHLDLRLVHGWVLSIAESYVVLAHTSMAQSVARLSVDRLVNYIRDNQAKFLREAGTTSDEATAPSYQPGYLDAYDP